MDLTYDTGIPERLRLWRENDRTLYEATTHQLEQIKTDPSGFGVAGTPFVPRLTTYSVHGRDAEYIITWEVSARRVFIASISSVAELQQRRRLGTA